MEKDNNLFTTYKKLIQAADLLKIQRIHAISILIEWSKNVKLLNYFIR